MGGITKALFGSEEKTKTRTYDLLRPSQRALLDKLANILTEQLGKGVEPYPGEMVEGMSPLQKAVLNELSGYTGPLSNLFSTGMQYATEEQPFDESSARSYWQEAFVKPTREAYWQQTVPALAEKYAALNAIDSSAFNRALANSAATMETNLGSTLAGLLYQGKQDWLDEQARRRTYGLQATEQAMAQLANLMGISDIERQIGQAQKEAEYHKWLYAQPYSNPWLNVGLITPTLGTRAFETQTFKSGGGTGLFGGLAGGLGSGLGTALGMSFVL